MVEVAVQRLYDALSPSTDSSGGGRGQPWRWAEPAVGGDSPEGERSQH